MFLLVHASEAPRYAARVMISLDRVRNLMRQCEMSVALTIDDESNPRTYFDFALADLSDGHGSRSRINAFSNAKRALHFQVEILADAFGIKQAPNVNRKAFPSVLDFCSKCGVVTPRILRKLNRVRNAMEHEYYIPSDDQTEDFVDVVELFLAATTPYMNSFPEHLELADPRDDSIGGISRTNVTIKLVPSSGMIEIEASDLTCDNQDIHDAAKTKKDDIDAQIAANKSDGVDVIMISEKYYSAYIEAANSLSEDLSGNISVSDNAFFDWARLITEFHAT